MTLRRGANGGESEWQVGGSDYLFDGLWANGEPELVVVPVPGDDKGPITGP